MRTRSQAREDEAGCLRTSSERNGLQAEAGDLSRLHDSAPRIPISPPLTPKPGDGAGKANDRGSKKRGRNEAGSMDVSGPRDGQILEDAVTPKRAKRPPGTGTSDEGCRLPTPESLPRHAGARSRTRKSTPVKAIIVEIPVASSSDAKPTKRAERSKSRKKNDSMISERSAGQIVSEVQAHEKKKRPKNKTSVNTKPGHGLADDRASQAVIGESGAEVLTRSEKGVMEPVGKIHLIQERLRYDPWKMLVATSLLNKTTGRAARPVLEILLQRWPSARELAEDLGWPIYATSSEPLQTSDLPPLPNPNPKSVRESESEPGSSDSSNDGIPRALDVKVFHGAGVYASDSFRIFSHLLSGRGGPERESIWLDRRSRALEKMRTKGVDWDGGVEMLGDWLDSDEVEEDMDSVEGEEEWRKVRPTGESSCIFESG
ncbi:hypothetical protein I317_03244 [Kwoniella heveanensis CBS 569]|nr:hypothetical protein I317_03244 [Kwoniella heveanensis CBS 569]